MDGAQPSGNRPWTREDVVHLFHMAYERKTVDAKEAAAQLDRTPKSCNLKLAALHKVVDELIGSWARGSVGAKPGEDKAVKASAPSRSRKRVRAIKNDEEAEAEPHPTKDKTALE
ncbi:uncharacterized protein PFL1_03757 [Pseudozyma flocculosa PF-1]|uniref:Uncharacterized protein n=1 Tax=Pseudozyma flocculosa PF-1 TaxID=1277687 RepID=A0A061H7L1_9BASI|nr:uncharacterized protein PFL1_03757 [Pseudozyma flocculosa PF-1]EPQ28454.1 hypothetical protein PFL1_03757 [Pseudozyma flocculosa PF-1]